MAYLGLIAFLAVLAAIYAPQVWVGHTMRRHGAERPDFPGTGGEMAQHLVERFGRAVFAGPKAPPRGFSLVGTQTHL